MAKRSNEKREVTNNSNKPEITETLLREVFQVVAQISQDTVPKFW